MKYLGQWEERCEKVIEELARIDGVIAFEDLLELVHTGGGRYQQYRLVFSAIFGTKPKCELSVKQRRRASTRVVVFCLDS